MKNHKSPQEHIGYLIRTIREREGLTQVEFARMLETSQSAIARMEKGDQNFTTKELDRIGETLGQRLVSLAPRTDDFEITGGHKLTGTVTTSHSKNGALALMAASLLNHGTTVLYGIPRIEEVFRFIEVFESINIKINWVDDHSLKITPPEKYNMETINEAVAGNIRVNLYLIPVLAHVMNEFRLPNPGGCKMGERTISAHKYALEKFGIKIKSEARQYKVSYNKLKPADITMYEASDMGVINVLMASALIPGKTIIRFAPPNYQVQDVCFFLEHLGVKIDGIGTTTLTVHGVKEIDQDTKWYNSEDPIESMFFISATIVTGGNVIIKRCPIDFLRLEMLKLEKMGLKFSISKIYKGENGRVDLVDIHIKESKLKALPDKIHALPYPGINNDNLPFFVPIATQATGTTLIHDWTWENRAIYFTEINRLGAKVLLADPHRVYIEGKTNLHASQIVCPPALRPATIILIAMLGAEGKSILRNVYAINRGYENLVERLNDLGGQVKQIKNLD
ncbi:UDP-N-acetylglucosamine 1-carboxyvinyltransferase [Candidatus Nomurabacteria bacterium RIFCSPHIGHO2_02_FULL_33_12]|uniref:UDP-N-acetylglucosamine 1-carboxyvinyltransferase n=1 Tax=Candidatus Nomurabacteria bacterium RIFCSPLOWO2_01_FULL_33_17 TaxID=1801764 RepID=A0A1F6WMN8_9BACT|nr:MAG: UDP-N-acetylglucosamine 1-carboxyvinyltransferase [Candidatus Nomurabacteria bacterium RIFCSPHIGHO2_02_FULL_33_12]OGI83150.1 MAG: UDP-N-acetylglucosamine 1-carboxyvinyltransferase [Candidatus Nomurabacteria bacterium RIFCSPLOWO2_01_FULL_33_17]